MSSTLPFAMVTGFLGGSARELSGVIWNDPWNGEPLPLERPRLPPAYHSPYFHLRDEWQCFHLTLANVCPGKFPDIPRMVSCLHFTHLGRLLCPPAAFHLLTLHPLKLHPDNILPLIPFLCHLVNGFSAVPSIIKARFYLLPPVSSPRG